MGQSQTVVLQSVLKRSAYIPQACQNCLSPIRDQRRRGSPQVYCSARCRKVAWVRRQSREPAAGKHGIITNAAAPCRNCQERIFEDVHILERETGKEFFCGTCCPHCHGRNFP